MSTVTNIDRRIKNGIGASSHYEIAPKGDSSHWQMAGRDFDLSIRRASGRWRIVATIVEPALWDHASTDSTLVLDVYDSSRTRGALYHAPKFHQTSFVDHKRGREQVKESGKAIIADLAYNILNKLDVLLNRNLSGDPGLVFVVREQSGLVDRLKGELVAPFKDVDIYYPGILQGAEPQLLVPRIAAVVTDVAARLSF